MVNKKINLKYIFFALFGIIISALVGACSLLIVLKMNPDWATQKITNVTKTEKEVTVTDEGISDAVDKLYNATVIVKVGSSEDNYVGWGSGVVYKTEGSDAYILTNHHVVENQKYINITFSNNTESEATLIGSDQYADVAVIKVNVDSIVDVAELGSSDDLKLGDTVFAIGTPISLNYKFTVTRGILSGKDRMVATSSTKTGTNIMDAWYMNLLQIDATINSGNSGGPLANSNGQVVGINNSKLSNNGSGASIENMGFAIPIEVALNVAEQLINTGTVTRPLLGVSMTTIEGAAQNGIELDESIKYGAVVNDVESGSSADKAGLKKGDVIVKFDEFKVDNFMYLKYYLYRHKVGDSIKLTYIRNGKENSVVIKLSN